MWTDIRASWALLIGVGFMMLGNGLQGTLLGVRATTEGFPTLVTGIMMSGYFVGIFIGSMLAPRLVNRVGHIRVFAALASLASIAILVHGLLIHPITWTLVRLVSGICIAGIYVVSESWLNERASNETRGQILSVYMVIISLGTSGGQFLLNLADPNSLDLFVLISIIVSFGLIPILLTVRPAPSFGLTKQMTLFELYQVSPLAVVSCTFSGIAHGTIYGLGAVYAKQSGFSVEQISWFMASILGGGLLFNWPIGLLSDRIDRRIVLVLVSILSIGFALLALMFTNNMIIFLIVTTLLGGMVFPMYSLSVSYANDRLQPEQIVSASGGLVMASGIGQSAGPIIVSFTMSQWGLQTFFMGIAVAFSLIILFALYRMGMSKPVAAEDIVPYVVTGQIGTPVAEWVAHDVSDHDTTDRNELDKLAETTDEDMTNQT